MASPTVPTSRCENCQQPATLICTGCKDAPAYESPTSNTYYCSTRCQMQNRSVHKKDCETLRMRKLLFRAGLMLQHVFYDYREQVYDKLITKVEKRDGKIFIHEGHYNPIPDMATVEDLLIPFPNSLVSNAKDKKAILTYLACADAVGWMQDLVQYVLKDMCSQFTEMSFDVKNPRFRVIMVTDLGEDKTDYIHNVIKVQLKKANEWYILDFAGAQYGFFDPVSPAPNYERLHTCTRLMRPGADYFGATKEIMLKLVGEKTTVGAGVRLNSIASKYLLKGMEDWEKKHSMTILALLRMKDEAKFQGHRATLLAGIQSWIDSIVEVLRDKAKEIKTKLAAGTLNTDDYY